MSKRYLVLVRCVLGNEEPTGQSLLKAVKRVTCARLSSLGQHDRQIPFDDEAQVPEGFQELTKLGRLDSQSLACHLNSSSMKGSGLSCKNDRSANQSLRSNQPNLDELITSYSRNHRNQPTLDKVTCSIGSM